MSCYFLPIKKRNVKGSSLIEVVTALLLISISMSLAGVLFSNFMQSSGHYLKMDAWFQLNAWKVSVEASKDSSPDEKVLEHYHLTKEVLTIDEAKHLYQVTMIAKTAEGKVLAIRRFYMTE